MKLVASARSDATHEMDCPKRFGASGSLFPCAAYKPGSVER